MSKQILPQKGSNFERGLQIFKSKADKPTELDKLANALKEKNAVSTPKSRLPLYLVVDTSASMEVQDKITLVNQAIRSMLNELKKDDRIRKSAHISVIAFNDTAKQIVPLTALDTFTPPALVADGNTSLGAALSLTAERIMDEIHTGENGCPDYAPTIFLMSDGCPNDEYLASAEKLKRLIPAPKIIAIAFGYDADVDVLKSVTSDVYRMESLKEGDFKKLFSWFTAIATKTLALSSSVPTNQKKLARNAYLQLPPLPDGVRKV